MKYNFLRGKSHRKSKHFWHFLWKISADACFDSEKTEFNDINIDELLDILNSRLWLMGTY